MTLTLAHNRPSLDDLCADPTAALKGQPLEVIALLMDEAKARRDSGAMALKVLQGALAGRYATAIAAAYQGAGKDTGTVRLTDRLDPAFEIVAERVKRVEWDQAALSAAGDRIVAAGDDPHEYITATYTVDERKFTAWPAHIRSVFEPARTVRPGPLSIKLMRREAA